MTSALGLIVAVLVQVSCLLPTTKQESTTHCGVGGVPLTTLDSVFVWCQPMGERAPYLVCAYGARGLEGHSVGFTWSEPRPATVWVTTRDTAGSVSCPSNLVGINLSKFLMAPGWYIHRRSDVTVAKDVVR